MVRRLATLLLVISLSLQGLGLLTGSWICEGRVCSTDLLRCCCAQPEQLRHSTCTVASASKGCPGKCKCSAAVTGKRDALASFAKVVIPSLAPLDLPSVETPVVLVALPVRLPETPLLANPPPTAVSCVPRDGFLLRAPPAPLA